VIRQQGDEPLINLDGGCVHHQRTGMGNLVALNLDSMELIVVEYREKEGQPAGFYPAE
jgi:hypothetical protein